MNNIINCNFTIIRVNMECYDYDILLEMCLTLYYFIITIWWLFIFHTIIDDR